jgi:hypothetical protein
VPDVGILSAAKRLEIPSQEEGFDRLFYIGAQDGQFIVEEWQDEVRRP